MRDVSVIIPTYNRNRLLLDRALPSVLDQTEPAREVIVVADGMVDPELDELARAIAKLDERVVLYNIERQDYPEDPHRRWCVLGLNARNAGLDRATSDWVAILDDDDEFTPDHNAVLLDAAEQYGCEFAYGRSIATWHDGRVTEYGAWPPGGGQFCEGSYVYRRSLGYRYDPSCGVAGVPADAQLWDRMAAGGVAFAFLDRVVHHYYPNPR